MLPVLFFVLLQVVGSLAQCGNTPVMPNTNNKGERDINNEIVGGVNAVPYSWPWQIEWCIGSSASSCSLSCGGSVVGNNWVITAGHCVYGQTGNPGQFMVKAGLFDYQATPSSESGSQAVKVAQIYLHPQYSQTSAPTYDIALIRLATPLTYSDHIRPVCLPSADSTQTVPPNMAWVTGWGTTSSGGQVSRQLKQVQVPFVAYSSCQNSYGVINNNVMVCAGRTGKDSCQGDSGGPLVQKSGNGSWYMYGIVSFGQGCASANYPGVYSRTSAYCNWISTTTGGQVTCSRPT